LFDLPLSPVLILDKDTANTDRYVGESIFY